jgi:hypothetical protein
MAYVSDVRSVGDGQGRRISILEEGISILEEGW